MNTFRSRYQPSEAVMVDTRFDEEGDLSFRLRTDGSGPFVYLESVEVAALRDHLTDLLGDAPVTTPAPALPDVGDLPLDYAAEVAARFLAVVNP